MSTWYLQINGIKRPLGAWGITQAKLTFGNQVTDTLTFTARAGLVLAFETACVLWLDDERRFAGIVTDLQFTGSPSGDRRDYTVSGPWWYLEKITYQQPNWIFVDGSDTSKGYTSIATSATTLFVSATNGGPMNTADQARQVINYARLVGAPISAPSISNLDIYVPWEEGNDLSCAEVVRRCLRWTPDAVAWWNYTAALPVLMVSRRSALPPIAVDLAAGNAVVELNPKPRYDLLPRGVQFNWQKTEVTDKGTLWISNTQQNAGVCDGGVRVIVITYKLAGQGSTSEPIPANLVTELWLSLATLQWSGSLVVNLVGASGTLGLGYVVNLSNGDSAWATMAALTQAVEEDLFTGETRIDFGPANQLGVQDFLALQSFKRDSKNPPNPPKDPADPPKPWDPPPPPSWPPPPPAPPIDDPGGGFGEVTFDVCDGGETRTVTCLGAITKKS